MDLFRSGIKSVLGTGNSSSQPTCHETVECLVERLNSSTLLDDRRNACRTLRALSKTYRLVVGTRAMDSLIHVLQTDNGDPEIIVYALETLGNITSKDVFEEEANLACESEGSTQNVASLGEQFTEIFTKNASNVCLLLSILDEYDFNTRWPTIRLLMNLLKNQGKTIQDIILVSPMGISKVMDLLSDNREVIRNEALLMLDQLTKGNANIQKIVVFENAFEHLLSIIKEEGYSEGNVVVEDCLHILLNLLKNNISNQTFFREGNFIKKLTDFFHFNQQVVSEGLSAQTVTNIDNMLQVVRTLVSPSNPSADTLACQSLMKQSGLLQALCDVLMANELTIKLLKDTINTVAEVIRKNINNQQFFLSLTAASSPPRPALVVLLFSMINEKQPFALRCAVLYCVQCFLYKNENGQTWIAKSLLPNSNEAVTAGRLLCRGLFSDYELSNWFAAVGLSHTINENVSLKEFLLTVRLSAGQDKHPALLEECTMLCLKSTKLQTRIGTLILLCTWLSYCPKAVNAFLQTDDALSYLISKVVSHDGDEMEELCRGLFAFLLGICVHFNDNSSPTISKEHLIHLIEKRVGFEAFGNKVNRVSKHEMYTRAHKHPQLDYDSPKDVVFDFEFCRLFKALESPVIKAVIPETVGAANGSLESTLSAEEERILNHYKDVIRQQDERLRMLNDDRQKLLMEKDDLKNVVETMESSLQQYQDENLLLRSQVQSLQSKVSQVNEISNSKDLSCDTKSANTIIEKQLISSSDVNNGVEYKPESETVRNLENVIASLQREKEQAELVAEKIRREEEDLLILLAAYETKLNSYKKQLLDLGVQIPDDDDDDDDIDNLILDEDICNDN